MQSRNKVEIAKTGRKSCANSTFFFLQNSARLLTVPQDCRASEHITNEQARQTREEGEASSPHVYLASSHLTLLAFYMMVNNLSISFDVIFRSLCELRTSNLSLNEDSITLVSVPLGDYHCMS